METFFKKSVVTFKYPILWPMYMQQEIAGKPNHFVEKIWEGLLRENYFGNEDDYFHQYLDRYKKEFNKSWSVLSEGKLQNSKLHTIKKSAFLNYYVGMRIKLMLQTDTTLFEFTPPLKIKRIQKIQILYATSNPEIVKVLIDNQSFYIGPVWGCYNDNIKLLANNEGFETVHHFFTYFRKNFSGKIIHWTTMKY